MSRGGTRWRIPQLLPGLFANVTLLQCSAILTPLTTPENIKHPRDPPITSANSSHHSIRLRSPYRNLTPSLILSSFARSQLQTHFVCRQKHVSSHSIHVQSDMKSKSRREHSPRRLSFCIRCLFSKLLLVLSLGLSLFSFLSLLPLLLRGLIVFLLLAITSGLFGRAFVRVVGGGASHCCW